MRTLSLTNTAIHSNLTIMREHLVLMIDSINTALCDIEEENRNAAIGALLSDAERFEQLKSLYDTCITLHRNADVIERHRDNKEV